jgi:hypothetical protein
MTVNGQIAGFQSAEKSLVFDQQPRQIDFQLAPAEIAETVNVTSEVIADVRRNDRDQRQAEMAPSVNVQSLQRRAAGVLPVRVDVPRAGSSHRFVKPLVVDEETVVSFKYRQR